jgi:hypothetical protein
MPLVGLGAWFSKKPRPLLIFRSREHFRVGRSKLAECLGADTPRYAGKHQHEPISQYKGSSNLRSKDG